MIGATGFIGSKIAHKLLERNCQLYIINRRDKEEYLHPRYNNKFEYLTHQNVNWINGSIDSYEVYKDLTKETDSIVHSAGMLWDTNTWNERRFFHMIYAKADWRQYTYPGSFERVQRDSALAVVDAVEENNRPHKFVYINAEFNPIFAEINPRYYITKNEACERLVESRLINECILYPGVVMSSKMGSLVENVMKFGNVSCNTVDGVSELAANGVTTDEIKGKFLASSI
eukprot:Mrub_08249.p2 GENE.Mrub_08249~~Mrub_08249.p2  ORF type:complete len:229 (+),score=44.55 Mrub_08249:3-689(+)